MSTVPSVLSIVAVAAAAGAVFCTLRWVFGRRDSIGRPNGFPKITLGLLLVLAVAAAYPGLARRHQEALLGTAASVIAGADVQVKCQTMGGAAVDAGAEAGYVKWGPDGVPEHVAHIKWEQCKVLRGYQRSDKQDPKEREYIAVHVLTHEAVHTSGVKSEALTECMAVQRDAAMAKLLGASDIDARKLAWLYWKLIYPNMPDEYRDAGCTLGGTLDEKLTTSPWVAGA